MKLGRNDPCHCGSGEKYKKCHLEKDEADKAAKLAAESAQRAAAAAAEAEAEAKAEDGAKAEGGPAVPRAKDPVANARPNAKKAGTAPPLFRRRSV